MKVGAITGCRSVQAIIRVTLDCVGSFCLFSFFIFHSAFGITPVKVTQALRSQHQRAGVHTNEQFGIRGHGRLPIEMKQEGHVT